MCLNFYDKIRKVYYYKNRYDRDMGTTSLLHLLNMEEAKLFMLLREGFTIQECADRLNKRRSDVKREQKEIFSKLKVGSITELIVKYGEMNQIL